MVRLETSSFLSLFVHYKVMQIFYFIGVDVSKNKFDICVMSKSKVLKEDQVSNHPQAIASVIAGIKEELSMNNDSFIICAEHTDQYTYPLICACKSVECKLWLENPSQIKYCSGVTRGKNNKVGARRIVEYAMRFLDKAKPYKRPTEELMRFKSVEGVGTVIAMNMIIATEAFTRFDNPRQFNCYVGVAPFSYTSGTSQHSCNRVSQRAVKYIKCLLHMAAVAIAHKKRGDLKTYFERKVTEGKNKMTVLNAVRAKLVARMFTVIRNNRIYQPILTV